MKLVQYSQKNFCSIYSWKPRKFSPANLSPFCYGRLICRYNNRRYYCWAEIDALQKLGLADKTRYTVAMHSPHYDTIPYSYSTWQQDVWLIWVLVSDSRTSRLQRYFTPTIGKTLPLQSQRELDNGYGSFAVAIMASNCWPPY